MTSAWRPERVVVTGLSGAGKTTALHALADAGCYCVDNMPPSLASDTVRVCVESGIERVALGMDVRVGAFLDALGDAVEELRREPDGLTVLFLDCTDESIVQRFHETRRPHPIHASGDEPRGTRGVTEAVRVERERLGPIRALSTVVVDTTHLTVHELRRLILERFGRGPDGSPRMQVRMVSFGFKHGVPLDANLVFDARFLDNPHFVTGLRELTGTDERVRDFVLRTPGAVELLEHLERLLTFAVPRYEQEGKSYLTVALGCTGGRHRSVALAIELAARLSRELSQRIGILHRDVARGAMMEEVSATGEIAERAPLGSTPPDEPLEGEGS